jgi:hypothetical protein
MLPCLAHFSKNFESSCVSGGGWKQTFDLRLIIQMFYHHSGPSRLIFVKTVCSPGVCSVGWTQTFNLRLMRQRLYHHAA